MVSPAWSQRCVSWLPAQLEPNQDDLQGENEAMLNQVSEETSSYIAPALQVLVHLFQTVSDLGDETQLPQHKE